MSDSRASLWYGQAHARRKLWRYTAWLALAILCVVVAIWAQVPSRALWRIAWMQCARQGWQEPVAVYERTAEPGAPVPEGMAAARDSDDSGVGWYRPPARSVNDPVVGWYRPPAACSLELLRYSGAKEWSIAYALEWPLVFLGSLQAPTGEEAIVAVHLRSGSSYFNVHFPNSIVWGRGGAFRYGDDPIDNGERSILRAPGAFIVYSGQADPQDRSHFVIGYSINGVRGEIDGWLRRRRNGVLSIVCQYRSGPGAYKQLEGIRPLNDITNEPYDDPAAPPSSFGTNPDSVLVVPESALDEPEGGERGKLPQ